jgi:hypothetical protein
VVVGREGMGGMGRVLRLRAKGDTGVLESIINREGKEQVSLSAARFVYYRWSSVVLEGGV